MHGLDFQKTLQIKGVLFFQEHQPCAAFMKYPCKRSQYCNEHTEFFSHFASKINYIKWKAKEALALKLWFDKVWMHFVMGMVTDGLKPLSCEDTNIVFADTWFPILQHLAENEIIPSKVPVWNWKYV